MMTADCLGSYGSLARFRDLNRLLKVGDFTTVGASGDISDFQYLTHTLEGAMYVSFYPLLYLEKKKKEERERERLGGESVFVILESTVGFLFFSLFFFKSNDLNSSSI